MSTPSPELSPEHVPSPMKSREAAGATFVGRLRAFARGMLVAGVVLPGLPAAEATAAQPGISAGCRTAPDESQEAAEQKKDIPLEFPGLMEKVKEAKGRLAFKKEADFEVKVGTKTYTLKAMSHGEKGDGEVVVLLEKYKEDDKDKERLVITGNTQDAILRFAFSGEDSPLIVGCRLTKAKGLPCNAVFHGVNQKGEDAPVTNTTDLGAQEIPPNATEHFVNPEDLKQPNSTRTRSFHFSPAIAGGQSEKGETFVGISDILVRNPDSKE